jgi:hypothetical protein
MKGGVNMNTQKNNPNELTVFHVDMDSVFDRYENVVKSNKRLTFALFACASYILIKNQVAKKTTKMVKEKLEELKKGE